MNLKLIRKDFAEDYTISDLLVDEKFECFVIEDKTRDPFVKIPGKTAIPYGRYRVVITYSNRFKRMLPELVDVPQYVGIRIHPGNRAEDTEGCLLPGQKKQKGAVLQSRLAFEALFAKIEKAINDGEQVWIEITKGLQQNFV